MGVAIDALRKDWNRQKVQYRKELEEWKRLEEELDKAKKNM